MIESPCIGICTMDEGKCIGCFRSSEHIMNWLYYNDKKRKVITKECLIKMKSKTINNKLNDSK